METPRPSRSHSTAAVAHTLAAVATTPRRNKAKGRSKMPLTKIADKRALQICFRKRRQGLFKKAEELTSLCGGEVAVVGFSPTGKPFCFGSVGSVVSKYRKWLQLHSAPPVDDEAANPDTWWRKPIDELGLEGLKSLKTVLKENRRALLAELEALPKPF